MAFDSNMVTSPSRITGTRPIGFMARKSGSRLPPKLPPTFSRV